MSDTTVRRKRTAQRLVLRREPDSLEFARHVRQNPLGFERAAVLASASLTKLAVFSLRDESDLFGKPLHSFAPDDANGEHRSLADSSCPIVATTDNRRDPDAHQQAMDISRQELAYRRDVCVAVRHVPVGLEQSGEERTADGCRRSGNDLGDSELVCARFAQPVELKESNDCGGRDANTARPLRPSTLPACVEMDAWTEH